MDGGYYKVDISDKVSIVSLNTLYFNSDAYLPEVKNEAINQMNWLEGVLKNEHRKIILIDHIYAAGRISHNLK